MENSDPIDGTIEELYDGEKPVDISLMPIDVGFDLRLHEFDILLDPIDPISVLVPDNAGRPWFWFVFGPRSGVCAVLRRRRYQCH